MKNFNDYYQDPSNQGLIVLTLVSVPTLIGAAMKTHSILEGWMPNDEILTSSLSLVVGCVVASFVFTSIRFGAQKLRQLQGGSNEE